MLLKEWGYRAAKAWEVGWTFHTSQKAVLLGRKTSEIILAPLPGVQETDGQADRETEPCPAGSLQQLDNPILNRPWCLEEGEGCRD